MRKLIIAMIVLALAAIALTACTQNTDDNSYTVTFVGSTLGTVTYEKGQNVVQPADPEREGYYFRGWFADADGAVPFDFAAARSEDVRVYAKWEIIPSYVFAVESLTDFFGDIDLGVLARYLKDAEGNLMDGYAVTAVTGYESANVVIPEKYNGKPVYVLGNDLFKDSTIKSVTIPASVVYIAAAAFKNCAALEEVIYAPVRDASIAYGKEVMDAIAEAQAPVSAQVTDAGIRAEMEAVKNVYLTCSRLCMIGSEVFYGCSSLEELTLPPMLTFMGTDSFYECRSLVTVYVEHRIDYGKGSYDGPGPSGWQGTHGFDDMFAGCIELENIYVYRYNGRYPVHLVPRPDGLLDGIDIYKRQIYWETYAPYIKAHPSGK